MYVSLNVQMYTMYRVVQGCTTYGLG